ncbi:ROK family protein [Mycobacterium antarcticum]|uniref:ROK family protein n=1 Tax=Mycolicibacterium sp. TUM20984 TaxID=3023368 RepID=UPI002382307F|nr:ROK family protein [Mycolicibacterium sp. TUM20984]GLP80003.1 hypothetical protein TUM20984_14230 [Mycolicibacterium sp. TUM20984]
MGNWAVGLDVGGTNMRAAEVRSDGSVGVVLKEPVDFSARVPFAQLTGLTKKLIDAVPSVPVGVGMGVTGPIDVTTGTIDNPYTLPASLQGDVVEALRTASGLEVVVENDANAAALGEVRYGAGRGGAVVVCITVGTGIGVGVVRDGALHHGAKGTHPEAGHLVVDPAGPLCYCGARGCVEVLASASAVATAGVTAGVIDEGGSAKDVHQAAGDDPRATAIVERARSAIAAAARTLVAVHGADTVILAGNGIGDVDAMMARVRLDVATYLFAPPGGVAVRPSALQGLAGCVGAAALVLAP